MTKYDQNTILLETAMLHDIYATSMAGRFRTQSEGAVPEEGTWELAGYGNAELRLKADWSGSGRECSLEIHSAERNIDYVRSIERWTEGGEERSRVVTIRIAGVYVTIIMGEEGEGTELEVQNEAVFDGPSPLWLIHMMLLALPPEDTAVTAPVVTFDFDTPGIHTGFRRFRRFGSTVTVETLDDQGEHLAGLRVEVSDDGTPRRIEQGGRVTEIVRIPDGPGGTV